MDVAVTGATGFVGRAVVRALLARGDHVRALSRSPDSIAPEPGVRAMPFDPAGDVDPAPFEGADAVIHLAGETVAGRWTDAKRQAIRESRVRGTGLVVDSIAACTGKPKVLVCASAVGYYGDRACEPLLESSAPGPDFLADVCVGWEAQAQRAQSFGLRAAWLRQGLVFGVGGGALAQMVPPFRAFAGGPFGNGSQWIPWIHIDDATALFLFVLDHDLSGPVNAVSPDIATSARIAHAIGAALRRPALAYAPGFALYAVLGEFASTLLASQVVLPGAALDAGFRFRHEQLEEALHDLLAPSAPQRSAVQTFEDAIVLNAPLEKVFGFLADPSNLPALTPADVGFRVKTPAPVVMKRGATIEYALKVRGLPAHWESLVTRWQPNRSFVDYQLRGPYELWRHEHEFEEVNGGVEVRDRVAYSLPLSPLSDIALPPARKDLKRIFDFRRATVARVFAA